MAVFTTQRFLLRKERAFQWCIICGVTLRVKQKSFLKFWLSVYDIPPFNQALSTTKPRRKQNKPKSNQSLKNVVEVFCVCFLIWIYFFLFFTVLSVSKNFPASSLTFDVPKELNCDNSLIYLNNRFSLILNELKKWSQFRENHNFVFWMIPFF